MSDLEQNLGDRPRSHPFTEKVSALRGGFREFEDWLASILNIDCFDLLEVSNDSYHVFHVGGEFADFDLSPRWLKFAIEELREAKIKKSAEVWRVQDILLCLCAIGLIDQGEYQIHVSW